MNKIKFHKYTGAGNNYIYIDGRNINYNWSDLSIKISDQNFGIGSDGLIVLDKSDNADFSMHMFNTDGSEGEMCGNGVRCLARFAEDLNVIPKNQEKITIDTKSGLKYVISPQYINNKMNRATVDMGIPIFTDNKIPVIKDNIVSGIPVVNFNHEDINLELFCVNTGVPHCVAFIDTPIYEFDLENIGPLVEKHDLFPHNVNFEIVNVINDNIYNVRVWERGSGITQACGTGATAVTAISKILKMHKDKLIMNFPGGELVCHWDGKKSIFMEGPIEFIGEGTFNINN